jgi:hypothetical protein
MAEKIRNFNDWKRFAKKYDFRCAYCNCDLLQDEHLYASAVINRFIPKAKGRSNMVLSCSLCNRLAGKRRFKNIEEARRKMSNLRGKYLKKWEYFKLRKLYRKIKQPVKLP